MISSTDSWSSTMFMSFVGTCLDTSKTSPVFRNGISQLFHWRVFAANFRPGGHTASRFWSSDHCPATLARQGEIFHGIRRLMFWEILGYFRSLLVGEIGWIGDYNLRRYVLRCFLPKCSSCKGTDINPKVMKMFFFTSLFLASIMDPELFLFTTAFFCNMFFGVGWQVGIKKNILKVSMMFFKNTAPR